MPKMTEEGLRARREEIMEACAKLYEKKSFKDITFRDISAETTLNRSSLYNYFQTKEEIFLALFQREYELWTEDLEAIEKSTAEKSRESFAEAVAKSLEKRKVLLKLLSMNLYDMEENSSMQRLTEFKRAYGASIAAMDKCLVSFFPQMDEEARQEFLYSFFPFMYGIYPYVFVTEKQDEAMQAAGVGFKAHSVDALVRMLVKKLLA